MLFFDYLSELQSDRKKQLESPSMNPVCGESAISTLDASSLDEWNVDTPLWLPYRGASAPPQDS
ncbi:hypothetical protein [Paraburkholderia terrae]|uniref:hypothetical protein n=1 Tax=Paraburkholderia terrae TaxID=311230 RepID=UPI0033653FBE